MFDDDEDKWFGFVSKNRFAGLPGPPGRSDAVRDL
jgi:hypothetical protein